MSTAKPKVEPLGKDDFPENFSTIFDFSRIFNQSESQNEIIFDTAEQIWLIGSYVLILILGLLFNAAIIWVIIARSNNRTPRNLYTVNLAISGILVGVFCVPTTMVQILYGGWWHFGLFACKLVPAIQGANILVSAFTITVIALDRWRSVTNTNPASNLTYNHVAIVIASIWILAFVCVSPLFVFQELNPVEMAGHVIGHICTEKFPNTTWIPDRYFSYGFTIFILMVQYLTPLICLPIVHAKIMIFLRRNAGFQNDARRKEREMKRNRRMTKTLSSISVIFAVSWLPYHIYLILTDIFIFFQQEKEQERYYFFLGICHCIAMTSIFTNPLMYGWFNTCLRSELESLLPKCCRDWLHKGGSVVAQNGASPMAPLPKDQEAAAAIELKPIGLIEKTQVRLIPRREQTELPAAVIKQTDNANWV